MQSIQFRRSCLWGLLAPLILSAGAFGVTPPPASQPALPAGFTNPVYEGADPWVTRRAGSYYLCRSEGDLGISVWKSDRISDPGVKRIVWRAPRRGWNAREIWAPELHYLQGRWFIYYAGSDGRNENHRAGVLEAATDDPQGRYIDRGMLYTGDEYPGGTNRWAIDLTPLELKGKLYGIWSGWPAEHDVQYLYIAPMADPRTIAGSRVKLCDNASYLWERVDEKPAGRGLHEGPEVLRHAGRVHVIYSCSGSWQPSYKLGMLWMDEDADPMNPASWHKIGKPVFQGNADVHGVGHASFVRSPDDREDWIVYHTKISPEDGWRRAVQIQPFAWSREGFPEFGAAAAPGRFVYVPSGEPGCHRGDSFAETFSNNNWDRWSYYGYNRFISVADQRLHLGPVSTWGLVNDYRSGEKSLVRGLEWEDARIEVRLRVEEGERDAGILFRVQQPAVGYDAFRGYFAGIVAGSDRVILGTADGHNWRELKRSPQPLAAHEWHTMAVEALGPSIRVSLDGKTAIDAIDPTYTMGQAGLRVVDTHTVFDDFRVTPMKHLFP